MPSSDLCKLFLLAALWGGSFIFMRISIADFGPLFLIEARTVISAVFLLGVTVFTGKTQPMLDNWKPITMLGFITVVLPFLCLGYAVQTLPAGALTVINATVPLFGALVAWVWLNESLTRGRILGLVIGFVGIIVLMADKLSFAQDGQGWIVVLALGGPFFYGFGACYLTKYLKGVEPVSCATGAMVAAGFMLAPFAIYTWPTTPISPLSWASVAALAIFCSGIAYVIFYNLVARIGASKSLTATFLAPPFGVFWGVVLLDEALTINIVLGTTIVLAGTLLATGFIGSSKAPAA